MAAASTASDHLTEKRVSPVGVGVRPAGLQEPHRDPVLDDLRDNCTSFQPFEHYQRFGMGEEN